MGGPASRECLMPTIAAPALTANRIDYWIPPHIVQYCYGTHPSQSKLIPRGGRRVGMLAIGKCLKDQYNALATPAPPASRCTRQETRRTGISARHASGRPCFMSSSFQENEEIADRLAWNFPLGSYRRQWAAVKCVTFSQSIQRGLSLMKSRF